jgi:hypothetical protein
VAERVCCRHADFATTQIYLREAENLSAGFGTVFPTLPDDLLAKPMRQGGVGLSFGFRPPRFHRRAEKQG